MVRHPNCSKFCSLTSLAEVGTPRLPLFFLVTSRSGVKSMTLSLDGARERVVGPDHAIVQCVSTMWTYRYHNGYIVTLRGPFTAYVTVTRNAIPDGTVPGSAPPTLMLKFDHIQFDSHVYEKHVAVDIIDGNRRDTNKINTPQIPNVSTSTSTRSGAGVQPPLHSLQLQPLRVCQRNEERWELKEPRITYERAFIPADPVNAFGVPQAVLRCLEVGSPNSMHSCLYFDSPRS